jgi:hypothetical protein
MKSPFPGMDPYIESSGLWEDFHTTVIGDIKRTLAPLLPDRYHIRTGSRSYVVCDYGAGVESDVPIPDAVIDAPDASDSVESQAFIVERFHQNYLEIYEAEPEERLVTCIELLSPSNKRQNTEGWNLYVQKRRAFLLGAANFVEIDLLRGGRRMPMLTPWPNSPYYILLCRRRRAPYCTAWPAGYREPLPPIRVPLDDPDPDIVLELQPMVEAIYARSRYSRSIDYTKPTNPPLEPADAGWLAEQLAKARAQ